MSSKVTRFETWHQTLVSIFFILAGIVIMALGAIVAAAGCFSEKMLIGGVAGIMIIAVGVMIIGTGARLPDIIDWIKKCNE
jgi:hypothetical protein